MISFFQSAFLLPFAHGSAWSKRMKDHETFLDEKHSEVFDAVVADLTQKKANGYPIERMKMDLETFYIHIDQDLDGRGQLFHIKMTATIAAYEALLHEWGEL